MKLTELANKYPAAPSIAVRRNGPGACQVTRIQRGRTRAWNRNASSRYASGYNGHVSAYTGPSTDAPCVPFRLSKVEIDDYEARFQT